MIPRHRIRHMTPAVSKTLLIYYGSCHSYVSGAWDTSAAASVVSQTPLIHVFFFKYLNLKLYLKKVGYDSGVHTGYEKKPEAQNLVLLSLSGQTDFHQPLKYFSQFYFWVSHPRRKWRVCTGVGSAWKRGGGGVATMRSVQVLGRLKCSGCGETKKLTFFYEQSLVLEG
jgi:hypothetical protein